MASKRSIEQMEINETLELSGDEMVMHITFFFFFHDSVILYRLVFFLFCHVIRRILLVVLAVLQLWTLPQGVTLQL